LLMGFFKAIPRDLEEAAMIDGYSRLGAFVKVVIPISVAGILTVIIFTLTLVMQEFVYALTFITAARHFTVSVGVPTFLVHGDVHRAHGPVLAFEEGEQLERHARVRALERDLVDPAPGEEGERRLVLTPLAAERRLPVDVGLDAVAVADMHGGRAADALDRPVKRLDPPRRDVVQVDIERGLVELEDVEPERDELPRLLVDNLRELQRKPAA